MVPLLGSTANLGGLLGLRCPSAAANWKLHPLSSLPATECPSRPFSLPVGIFPCPAPDAWGSHLLLLLTPWAAVGAANLLPLWVPSHLTFVDVAICQLSRSPGHPTGALGLAKLPWFTQDQTIWAHHSFTSFEPSDFTNLFIAHNNSLDAT